MGPIEYLLAAIFLTTSLFPVGFILYKRGNNKLFFIAAVIGTYTLVELLLMVTVLPIGILLVKVVPQLAEQGQVTYILPLLHLSGFVQEWWFIMLHPVLSLWLPVSIYNRYYLFHLTNKGCRPKQATA